MGFTVSELRVGVVGLGFGQMHLLNWLEVPGASVVAIADIDERRRRRAERDWSLVGVDSLDALLAMELDVVDLCTPPVVHEAQIEQCLTAGVHVVCEKPLVDSVAACDRVRALAERSLAESGARLMPVLQYRFGAGAAQARALVEAGVTGRLFTASASTWWRRDASYYAEAPWRGTWEGERGGTVLSHSLHVHDLLTWIGGPLVEVRALTATRVNPIETEDCAVAIGRTTDGALMSMNVNLGAATESSRLVWCFENVTIESSTEAYNPAAGPWTFEFTSPDAAAAADDAWAGIVPTPPLLVGQLAAFVAALTGGGAFPVTVDDAQASLELVTAWYRSARTGSVETLPLAAEHPDRESWCPSEPREHRRQAVRRHR